MRVTMGIEIAAPPMVVWPYLVVPEKAMAWYDALTVFEYTDGGPGPDATFYWEEVVRGTTYATHFRTTAWEPGRLFAYEMTESSFFVGYTERWTIEERRTGCYFSFDDELVFPYGPWGRVMGWFGERMARSSGQQILETLRGLAEADTVTDAVVGTE